MGAVSIGVDIGQQRDPTALAVVERQDRSRWALPRSERVVEPRDIRLVSDPVYVAREIGRLSLGTPYPEVAEAIRRVVDGIRLRYKGALEVRIDSTGVGAPVVDLVRAQVKAVPYVEVLAVSFTHGDRFERKGSKEATLGKAYLVSRLQALLQTRSLKLPRTSETEALEQELKTYEIKVSENGNDTYGAFRVGTHDDLVTALGLAVLPLGPSRRLVTF
ncbi:MAG: hypothetical protein ACM3US_02435 [Sphingomonadaceae bacterium]